jgi:hypothetical protein
MHRRRSQNPDRGRYHLAADRAHAGRVDCEHVRAGLVGQPVNTVTSAAYLGVSAWLLGGRPRRRRWVWAGLSAGVGVGSMGFHGPGDRAGKVVHDVFVDALALAIVGSGIEAMVERRFGRGQLEALALLGAGVVVHRSTQTGRPGCRPDTFWQGHGLWHVVSALAIARWVAACEPQVMGARAAESPEPTTPAGPA